MFDRLLSPKYDYNIKAEVQYSSNYGISHSANN